MYGKAVFGAGSEASELYIEEVVDSTEKRFLEHISQPAAVDKVRPTSRPSLATQTPSPSHGAQTTLSALHDFRSTLEQLAAPALSSQTSFLEKMRSQLEHVEQTLPFQDRNADPFGVLRRMVREQMLHKGINVVGCYRRLLSLADEGREERKKEQEFMRELERALGILEGLTLGVE